MIGVAYQGIAFLVVWEVLGKKGSSSVSEGKALFERSLRLAGPDQIRAVVGDREFIGEEWLAFLAKRQVPFAVRLRRRRRLALGSPDRPALPAEPKRRSRSTAGVGRSRCSLRP